MNFVFFTKKYKNMLYKILIIFSFIAISCVCQKELSDKDEYFSREILDKYDEYTLLEEYEKVCNYDNLILLSNEETVKQKIVLNNEAKTKNCVPDNKSFLSVLENGWFELANFIIKDIFFPKLVDPSQILLSYTNKNESKIKVFLQFMNNYGKTSNIDVKYLFENFDEKINFSVVLPDASYSPESISIFCYKDLFKINSVFKSKGKLFRINVSKKLYDHVTGKCEHTFNSFSNQIEVKFDKLNKMKKWERLFN